MDKASHQLACGETRFKNV